MQPLQQGSSGWVVAKASVIGRGHVMQGLPCQDAHGWFPLAETPSWGVAVVSDGAGSHENSHLGSAQVVKLAGWKFAELLMQQGWAAGQPLPTPTQWKHLALEALHEVANQLGKYAEANEIPYRSLGATVIVAVFGPTGLLLAHIGDGRAAGQTQAGEWIPLLTPFRGEEANATVFITSRPWTGADADLYLGSTVYEQPFRAFALLSDGCEMATFQLSEVEEATGQHRSLNRPFRPVFEAAASQLRAMHQQGMTGTAIDNLWAQYLTAGTEKLANETDDKTWLLALNLTETGQNGSQPSAPLEVANPPLASDKLPAGKLQGKAARRAKKQAKITKRRQRRP